MPYPDTFEGFMVSDQKNWTDFSKKEVCHEELSTRNSHLLT